MSSFVVDKIEFVKAAGLMYGIEESKCEPHRYFLQTVRAEFVNAYDLNVDSVNEQYGDDASKDTCTYDDEFEKYRKIGGMIWGGTYCKMKKNELRLRLWNFFRSVLYQIECDNYHDIVGAFFFECISKLYESDVRAIEGWWGEIEL